MLKPITSVKAMQGWNKDERTGQLNNSADPGGEVIKRSINFMVKDLAELPKPTASTPQDNKNQI